MDPEKFKHDSSRYERPTRKFTCGRAASWGKPCEFGPHVSGRCGGTSECRPAKVGDRWECRRSAIAGGPCKDGPGPDGGGRWLTRRGSPSPSSAKDVRAG